MSRNPNAAPTPNPYDTRADGSPERVAENDPARLVVDSARELRESYYSTGAPTEAADAMFEQDQNGQAGGFELIQLINELRHEGRSDLNAYEQQFMGHMQKEKAYYEAAATVNMDELQAKGREEAAQDDLSDEDAKKAGLAWIIADLKQKEAAATDDTQKQELAQKIDSIETYRAAQPIDRSAGEQSLERNFMRHAHAAEHESGDQKKSAERFVKGWGKKLETRDQQTDDEIAALRVIDEYFPKAPVSAADLQQLPLLEYVDPTAAPEDAPETPETPAVPARNPAVAKMEQQALMEMEEQELTGLRKEMAELKAGGRLNNFFKGGARNGAERNARLKNLEAMYNSAVVRKQMRQYGDLFADSNVDPKVKNYLQVKSLFAEQEMLRTEMNDVLQNTKVAKIAKWIGKHKLIVAGTGILLAPMTFGTSAGAGLALAGGLIAASKIDSKTRGLGTFESSITQEQLLHFMNSGHSYKEVVRYASTIDRRDIGSEKVNRTLLTSLGGVAAGAVGFHYFGALNGMSHALYGTNHYIKGTVDAGIFAGMVKNDKK